MQRLQIFMFAFSILTVATELSFAADEDVGRMQFLYSCAACHGEDGRGGTGADGLFSKQAPDLTRLAARSGGTFPFDQVVATIDGRGGLRGHRSPMPVWGMTFQNHYDAVSGSHLAELMARGAILSVALYLAEIQEY